MMSPGISFESMSLLHDLHGSPAFQRALNELIAHERATLIDSLRGYVSAGNIGAAQGIEGQLYAWEMVQTRIKNVATLYAERSK